MPAPKKLTTEDIKGLVADQIGAAIGGEGSDIANDRAELMERYLGEPYGDEEQDRSAVVSTDVNDVIESILPDMMEIFAGGDSAVKFEPTGPEDEKAAQQETDVVQHVFEQSNGFLVLYEFFKDAMILKNGFVKFWWDDRTTIETVAYADMSQAEIDEFIRGVEADGDECEITRQTPIASQDQEPEPDPMAAMMTMGMPSADPSSAYPV